MDASTRRYRGRRGKIAAGVALALVAVFAAGSWLARSSPGESCLVDGECRSGSCLRLQTLTPGGIRLDGQVCSASCASDLDCPPSMHCTDADPNGRRAYALNAPPGPACIPNGY